VEEPLGNGRNPMYGRDSLPRSRDPSPRLQSIFGFSDYTMAYKHNSTRARAPDLQAAKDQANSKLMTDGAQSSNLAHPASYRDGPILMCPRPSAETMDLRSIVSVATSNMLQHVLTLNATGTSIRTSNVTCHIAGTYAGTL